MRGGGGSERAPNWAVRRARKLDRACEPQAQLHRRRNEFAVRVSDWNAGRHFRIADYDVVAMLSLERNAISELHSQGL